MDSTPEQPFAEKFPERQASEFQSSELEQPAVFVEVIDPPPPSSTAHRIFFGPFGLRAGWSLLIYFAILASIIFGVHLFRNQFKAQRAHTSAMTNSRPVPTPSAKSLKPNASTPAPLEGQIIGEAVIFAIIFLLSWLMASIEHRKLSVFGLGGTHSLSRLLIGAFWGIAAISLLIAVLRGFHFLTFDTRLDHGRYILFWGAAQLFTFLLVGLVEEYLFRGYIQFTLTRGLVSLANLITPRHARAIAFWIAAFLTSALFLYAHTRNDGETLIGLFQVFLAGAVFVVALWRTGSLWWAIGFHMAWDWAQSFLYGVPDSGSLMQGRLFATHALGNPLYSGGTAGPEGSMLCVPILLLVIVVLLCTHPSPQPPLETRFDLLQFSEFPSTQRESI